MFGSYKRLMQRRAESLGRALEHVGVYPGELVEVKGGVSAMLTAENVLLRQAEEIAALREMLDRGEGDIDKGAAFHLDIARRNLAYERQARSADNAAYADALRAAGREKAALTLCHDAAHRELNAVLDVLIERRYVVGVEDGDEVNLPLLVALAVDGTIVRVAEDEPTAEQIELPLDETQLPTLREQAEAVIANIKQPNGSFDAAEGFTRFSATGDAIDDGWRWTFEGLAALGYRHNGTAELNGRRCVWEPVNG